MNLKTVQTFRNLGRRSSVYGLIDGAETIKNIKYQFNNNTTNVSYNTKNTFIEELKKFQTINSKNSKLPGLSIVGQTSFSSESKCSSSVSKSSSTLNEIKNSKIFPYNQKQKTHYSQNRLPVLTNSQRILKELSEVSKKDEYYKKFFGENNFGKKYVDYNLISKDYSKNTFFLNDEEKNPLSLIDNKKVIFNKKAKIIKNSLEAENNKNNKNISILIKKSSINLKKRNNFLGDIINNTENNTQIKTKKKQSKSLNKKYLTSKNFTKIVDHTKHSEFSHFLITNYLKNNHSSLSNQKLEKFLDNKSSKNLQEKRIIYVIKDSTVITNAQIIPGFFAQIPTKNFLKNLSTKQRLILVKQFCEFATNKFRSKVNLNCIHDRNGNPIIDFIGLNENEKYIFISVSNSFHGISISYNKRIANLYQNLFLNKKINKYYFNESSFTESIIDKNNNHNSESDSLFETNNDKDRDDLFDIYFNNKNNKIKNFKKIKTRNKKISKNFSFTFGLEDEKYKYIIYSEDEDRKKNIEKNIFSNCKKKIDYFIELENNIYENKLNNLLSKLSKNKRNTKKPLSNKELMDEFLTQKKIPKKNMLKNLKENKPLKPQDIIDSFNILKYTDPSINISKFFLTRKKGQKNTPYVEKNKIDNSDKYLVNNNKINKEYPTILSYNLPLVVEKYPKYSLTDLIKYYTKFKSLVNLWLNMHPDLKVVQYGIDFNTFYNCTEELCHEEIELVKKIYDTINSGSSGILSLEDYIDAMNTLNRNDLIDQFEFFLKVFDAKDKIYLSYNEILQISSISIKRLIKSKDGDKENITKDLSEFFASFIFRICNCKKTEGLEIKKFKEVLLNDKTNMEYLKLFLCSFGDPKSKNNSNESKMYNPLDEVKKLSVD